MSDPVAGRRSASPSPSSGGDVPEELKKAEERVLAQQLPTAGSIESVPLGSSVSPRDRRRKLLGLLFAGIACSATFVGVVALGVLLVDVVRDGIGYLDSSFLTSFASRIPERAGIKAALWGSIWIMMTTAAVSFPLSVGAAIYLEEYAPRNWLTRLIQTNIANLAGVPSIVYGILGLAVFVRFFSLDRSVLSGALTLTILILPVIVMASQEAIRAVPDSIRQAAYGLGATRWQVVRHQVLPMSMPGILTGTILALSRAIGETAPLIMVGAVGFLAATPSGLGDRFTVLPLQIYDWVGRPQEEFRAIAAAGIIVLLTMLLSMNALAIFLRNRFSNHN